MKARDLARPYPLVRSDAAAEEAGRLLAQEAIDVVVVHDGLGRVVGALHDLDLLERLLPHYLVADRGLARVLTEADADALWSRLADLSVGDLVADARFALPTIGGDATLVQVAAEMVGGQVALIAVVDDGDHTAGAPPILGGITASALITALLADR